MAKYMIPSAEVFATMARTVNAHAMPDDSKAALFFPVVVALRDGQSRRSANCVIAALDYARVVVEQLGDMCHIAVSQKVFVELLAKLGSVCEQPSLSPGDLVEIRSRVFNLVILLFSHLPSSYLAQIFTARCLPGVAHFFTVLTTSIESSASPPALKVVSLKCLKAMILCGGGVEKRSDDEKGEEDSARLQHLVSLVIVTVMPGILATLASVLRLSADPRTGHSILVESLEVFTATITVVLNEQSIEFGDAGKNAFLANCPSDGLKCLQAANILPALPLTDEYLKLVGQRVSPVITSVFAPSLYSSMETVDIRVRNAAFHAAFSILNHSSNYLDNKQAYEALLNCVSAGIADADVATKEVKKLHHILSKNDDLAHTVEDLFLGLVKTLPKLLLSPTINFDAVLSARLASLVGLCQLLGSSNLTALLSSHDCLKDLFRCVTHACRLIPMSDASLSVAPAPPPSHQLALTFLSDSSFWNDEFLRQKLPFRFLENRNCLKLFELFLEKITLLVEEPSTIASFFYEMLVQQLVAMTNSRHPEDNFQLESATYVLSVIITKISQTSHFQSLELVALACVERFCSDYSLLVQKNRAFFLILSACAAALASSKEAMSTVILRSILALLEACSSGKPFIENHAVHTLADVARSTGAETLSSFIEVNADYLANAFMLRLRHLNVSKQTLFAISAAFRFSQPACLPYFSDPLRDILGHIPTADLELAELLLLATNNALSTILRWNLPFVVKKEAEELETPELDNSDDAEGLACIARTSTGQLPQQVVLARDAADSVANLFHSRHVTIKLAALEVARLSILIVKPATNELLPLVHRLWPGLSDRFIPKETKKQIIIRSLDLLLAIAETSGDFVRHRFVTGMLPHVCSVMSHLSSLLAKSDVRLAVYRQTFDFKLLVRLTADLPRIAKYVKITVKSDLVAITNCVLAALTQAVNASPEVSSLEKSALLGICILTKQSDNQEEREDDSSKIARNHVADFLILNSTNTRLCDILQPYT